MTQEGQFLVGLGATVAVNAAMIGAAWGSLTANLNHHGKRLNRIETKLGIGGENGGSMDRDSQPVTHGECALIEHGVGRRIDDIAEAIGALRDRMDR